MISRKALNWTLLLAFVGSLGLHWATERNPAVPNREFLPEMVRTARYNAFSANPNFPDAKTLQRPVPGTIPRGWMPLHYLATPADALRAGEELRSPVARGDAHALARGAQVFVSFCRPCHGFAGRGDGLVVQRGFPAPPSLLADHARNMWDGQIFHILTYGQGNMPSYAAQIAPRDRWDVIDYVRSLQMQSSPVATGGQP